MLSLILISTLFPGTQDSFLYILSLRLLSFLLSNCADSFLDLDYFLFLFPAETSPWNFIVLLQLLSQTSERLNICFQQFFFLLLQLSQCLIRIISFLLLFLTSVSNSSLSSSQQLLLAFTIVSSFCFDVPLTI